MATETLPLAPPLDRAAGPIGWMRRNLFATPFDVALTLLVLWSWSWWCRPCSGGRSLNAA